MSENTESSTHRDKNASQQSSPNPINDLLREEEIENIEKKKEELSNKFWKKGSVRKVIIFAICLLIQEKLYQLVSLLLQDYRRKSINGFVDKLKKTLLLIKTFKFQKEKKPLYSTVILKIYFAIFLVIPIVYITIFSINKKLLLPDSSSRQLHQLAESISVHIVSGNSQGSGILIEKQDGFYTVITNAHVIEQEGKHIIRTHDGHTHKAKMLFNFNQGELGDDLAVLQFHSEEKYTIATLNLNPLTEKEQVFAAGFPSSNNDLLVLEGNVSLVLDRPLKRGYQVGYSIDVQEGMSGGALLNSKGTVIGINGKHSYPLFGDKEFYKDGSEVKKPKQLLKESSWAIPVNTLVKQTPPVLLNSMNLNLPKNNNSKINLYFKDLDNDKNEEIIIGNSLQDYFPLQILRRGNLNYLNDVTHEYPDLVYEHASLLWRDYEVRDSRNDHDNHKVKELLAAYLVDKHVLCQTDNGWNFVKTQYQESDREEFFQELSDFLEDKLTPHCTQ